MGHLNKDKVYYLGGPMTGHAEFNFPAFEEAATYLRSKGFKIKSAHEIDFGETKETRGQKPYGEYIKGCLALLGECDAAIFLDGWTDSTGAKLEASAATTMGMQLFLYKKDLPGRIMTFEEVIKNLANRPATIVPSTGVMDMLAIPPLPEKKQEKLLSSIVSFVIIGGFTVASIMLMVGGLGLLGKWVASWFA